MLNLKSTEAIHEFLTELFVNFNVKRPDAIIFSYNPLIQLMSAKGYGVPKGAVKALIKDLKSMQTSSYFSAHMTEKKVEEWISNFKDTQQQWVKSDAYKRMESNFNQAADNEELAIDILDSQIVG